MTGPEFRLIAESLPLLVGVTDTEGRTEYVNQKTLDYTGLKFCRSLPVRGPDGRPHKWIGTGTDIDNFKRAESELVRLRGAVSELPSSNG